MSVYTLVLTIQYAVAFGVIAAIVIDNAMQELRRVKGEA